MNAIDALAQIRFESDLWWLWVCGKHPAESAAKGDAS